jgi:hypothetical protein
MFTQYERSVAYTFPPYAVADPRYRHGVAALSNEGIDWPVRKPPENGHGEGPGVGYVQKIGDV